MQITMQKILFPTDFSDTSRRALAYAVSFAREFGAELIVLHVIDEQLFSEGLNLPRAVAWDELEKEMVGEAGRRMESLLASIPDPEDLRLSKVIIEGKPFAEIIKFGKENAVDLIVIGTHGRTGLEHVIFGSTAERVVRSAASPVLTVKPA